MESMMSSETNNNIELMPSRYSKHQTIFGKFAASQAACQDAWSPACNNGFPATPITPSMGMSGLEMASMGIASDSLNPQTELLTPDSLQNYYPGDMSQTAGNSPLFDGIDAGDMQSWESLFMDEDLQQVSQIGATTDIVTPEIATSQTGMIEDEANFVDHFFMQDALQPSQHLLAENQLGEVPSGEPQLGETQLPETLSLPEIKAELPDFDLDASPVSSPMDALASPSMRASEQMIKAGGVCKGTPKRRTKVDDLGITVYQRKPRAAPLKPVEIPEDADDASAKRAKNTEAARRSRARKLERMSQLEDRIRLLMEENDALRSEIKDLKNNKA